MDLRTISRGLVAAGVLLIPSGGWADSTHPAISLTRGLSSATAVPGNRVTVTLTLNVGAIGAGPLRGFYLSDNVPLDLIVVGTPAVTLNGSPVGVIREFGVVDEVCAGARPYRWIFETPPDFGEGLAIPASSEVVVTYVVETPADGAEGAVYTFSHANWVGMFPAVPEDHYGYLDPPDATITLTVVSAPVGLVATAGDRRVDLDWEDSGAPDLEGYDVYRSLTSGGSFSRVNGALVVESRYTDTGLENGVTYFYVVRVVCSAGESPDSNEVSATPAAPAEVAFWRGDADGSGRITLVDAIIVLTHTFRGGQPIPCRKSADIDDSGKLDLADVIHMLMYIFVGSPAPRPPFPGCGFDETPDILTCESFPPCP